MCGRNKQRVHRVTTPQCGDEGRAHAVEVNKGNYGEAFRYAFELSSQRLGTFFRISIAELDVLLILPWAGNLYDCDEECLPVRILVFDEVI